MKGISSYINQTSSPYHHCNPIFLKTKYLRRLGERIETILMEVTYNKEITFVIDNTGRKIEKLEVISKVTV